MLNGAVVVAVGLMAVSGLCSPCGAVDREVDRRQILRVYESVRAAHFSHDGAAFLAANDASWYSVTGGDVALRRKRTAQLAVQEYLDSVTFTEIVGHHSRDPTNARSIDIPLISSTSHIPADCGGACLNDLA